MSGIALNGDVVVAADPPATAAAVASWLRDLSTRAVAQRGRFLIALSGGSTPRLLYELLATPAYAATIAWPQWVVFFGDERACAADDPQRNSVMAREALLAHVPVNPADVHVMAAEDTDLDGAARAYARALVDAAGNPPVLDCVLLGLGENGHTASLFPDTAALAVHDTWCTRGRADYVPFDRLTLTYDTINAARHVAFIVTGGSKAEAFAGVRAGMVPAAGIRPTSGDLHWFLDEAAAASTG